MAGDTSDCTLGKRGELRSFGARKAFCPIRLYGNSVCRAVKTEHRDDSWWPRMWVSIPEKYTSEG